MLHESCLGFPCEITLSISQGSPSLYPRLYLETTCTACLGLLKNGFCYSFERNPFIRKPSIAFHLQCAISLSQAIESECVDRHHDLFYFGSECQQLLANVTTDSNAIDAKTLALVCHSTAAFFVASVFIWNVSQFHIQLNLNIIFIH